MSRPTVSVVIPTRNNLAELTGCLASLQAQTHPPARVVILCGWLDRRDDRAFH